MVDASKIKIGVIGLGPVGLILAVKLKQAGCEVAICDKDDFKLKKIREEGVALENMMETKVMFDKVCDAPSEMAEMNLDYLVFALKSYHTPGAAKEAECLNSDKLTVISAQNGIDIEELLYPVFGESKTMRMIINYAGTMNSPNVVRVSFFTPPNYIGPVDDKKGPEAERFAEILNISGLTTKKVDSFELVKSAWEKTILNASLSALCGVSRMTMAEAMADSETIELIEQIIQEGLDVAEKEKIHFPDDFNRKCMRYLKNGGDHFPSLAIDLINNRQTEINYFNGKIVEYGKKHYVRTSLNLALTNMVKAMTNKNVVLRIPGAAGELNKKIINKGLVDKSKSILHYKDVVCYLGIDLGSAYTKFVVIDEAGTAIFRYSVQTINKDKNVIKNVMQALHTAFDIRYSCATGYGRKHFPDTDIVKTEINCASVGVSEYVQGEKNIIDIGGEDIKIIQCGKDNNVNNFYMNDKCAAGTGAFLTEIAERAEISIADMSNLAAQSNYNKELNSFCTVFAKTEIMHWVFDGMSNKDIAKGIYISIANKVAKMRITSGMPIYIIGGVIAHHPHINSILSERFHHPIQIIEHPQFVVAYGAAIIAKNNWHILHPKEKIKANESIS